MIAYTSWHWVVWAILIDIVAVVIIVAFLHVATRGDDDDDQHTHPREGM